MSSKYRAGQVVRLKERDRSEVYDRLYALASKLLARNNACATCPIGCPGVDVMPSKIGCCFGCRHNGPAGCAVEALACKLWLCDNKHSNSAALWRRLSRLKRIAQHYNIYVARASKEESLAYGGGNPWILYPNSEVRINEAP